MLISRNDISEMVNLLDCGSSSENDSVVYDDYTTHILHAIKTYEDSVELY